MTSARNLLAVLVSGLAVALPAASGDWPQFRGPHLDGTSSGNGLPAPESLGLELAWERPLGSGYSSISVADGKGATLFSDGDHDYVTVFDARTGEELWRRPIDATYRGHDGSSDGPTSTPALHDGTVFALGPKGRLLALAVDDGEELWSYDLDAAPGSRAPMYGYSTAPVVVDGLLIVQTGSARGRSVTAFDPTSGEVRWTAADDPVSHQSPAVLELLGRRQLVAAGDGFVFGLEPASGEVLWKARHTAPGEAAGASAHPLKLADNRFLLRPSPDEAVVYELAERDGGVVLEEVWRATLKRSHAAVVAYQGRLYSYDTHFLTCLDAATGKRLWKSRPPGGRGLIRIDGYLVVLGAKGDVVVAEAASDGYRETARLHVFERDGWTPPSFADGRVYVRNLEAMASLRISARPAVATRAKPELRGRFGEIVRRIESAEDRKGAVDEFMAKERPFPMIEDGGLVHFVFRGEAADVAVAGNMTADFGEEVAMTRIEGTDLYFRSFELDPASHYEYRFHVDFGGPLADPGNPHTIGSIFGPSSELRMPGWTEPEPERLLRGRLESLEDGERSIRIYLPPGYDDSGERYPLLVVQEGEGGETAALERMIDSRAGRSVSPVVAVFLPRLAREHDREALTDYARWVTGDLLPRLDRSYRVAEDRALLGSGSGAPIAAWIAFTHPGVFAKLGLQSFFLKGLFGKLGAGAFSMTPEAQDELLSVVGRGTAKPLEVYVEWSVRESADPSSGLDAKADTERLLAALAAGGYAVRRSKVAGAPGYGSWRAQVPTILETLFPADSTEVP